MADCDRSESQPLLCKESLYSTAAVDSTTALHAANSNSDRTSASTKSCNENCTTSDGTSNAGTIAHLMKVNIGTGILAMPYAFSHSGILAGVLGLIILCALCVHCMHLLVKCSNHLCSKNVVNAFQMLIQFGSCCTYILFVSRNIQFVVMKLMGNVGKDCDPRRPMVLQLYELCVTVLLILLVFIRNIKYLAPFSALANIASTVGLGVILYDVVFHEGFKSISQLPLFNGWDQLALYFGSALYAFGSISLILPLRNSMKEPEAYTHSFGVINVSLALACAFQIAMGFYGYLAFGDKTAASITLNLTSWYGVAIQLTFSFAIFITYGVMFFAPMDIIGDTTNTRFAQLIGPNIFDYLLRASLVLMTYLVVVAVDRYLGLLIALVGSFTCSAATLIFPPVLEIMTFWPIRMELKGYWAMCAKDCIIILLGFLGLIAGTSVAVQQLIANLTSNDISGACPPALNN